MSNWKTQLREIPQNHTLKMHGGGAADEEFECEMCGKSYKHQAQFVKHLQVGLAVDLGNGETRPEGGGLSEEKRSICVPLS